MLDNYCKTGNTYHLKNIPEETKKFMLKVIPIALRKHSPGSKYYDRSLEIMDILSEHATHNIRTSCDKLQYMINVGSSCYLDSVLFSLFIFPCEFVQSNILYTDLKQRRLLTCGNSPEQDLQARKNVQKSLQKIEDSIHGGNYVRKCDNLRSVLKKCPSSENYHTAGDRDAGEFLQYILDMFNTNVATKSVTTYGTNNITDDIVPENELEKTSVIIDVYASVIQFVTSFDLVKYSKKEIIDIRTFLKQAIDSGELEADSQFRDSRNPNNPIYFKRRIAVSKLDDTPFIVFRIQRLHPVDNKVIQTPILPSGYVTLENKKMFSLSAIVVWKSSHFICYFKCYDDWFKYDDLSGIKKIGSYDEMIYSSPSPVKNGTLYFYIPM